ncbi:MAG TPA: 3'(2'),5'-bisphosphate nucleotidase CysQ, partial [Flavobacteriaceae bacterium]|nr:3'(2'),5'-bisphosphate nucleotidase CysQ [Flavobacteriaceae bacterium]
AWKAGLAILDIYESDFEVAYKDDASPITEADQRADKAIRSVLKADRAPIISEEIKQVAYQERKHWNAYWLVDPLDGTKEFIEKNDEFTVNIAYVENGEPRFGILYVPAAKTMYLADVDKKLVYQFPIVNDIKESDFEQLINFVDIIENPKNTELKTIAVSRSHLDPKTQASVDTLTANGTIKKMRLGSALKYAKLVTGEVQLYFRFSPTMEWDNAAGHAICLASGLKMYSLPDKESIKYNSEDLYSPYFVAGTKNAVNQLFEAL